MTLPLLVAHFKSRKRADRELTPTDVVAISSNDQKSARLAHLKQQGADALASDGKV